MEDWLTEDISDIYAKDMIKYPTSIAKYVINKLISSNPENIEAIYDVLLDAGCGTGDSVKHYLPYFRSVVGFDISPQQIVKAKSLNESSNVSFLVSEGNPFPAKDKSVDLILSVGAVHYMNFERFVKECKRVLKDTGLVALYSHGIGDLLIKTNSVESGEAKTISGYEILMSNYVIKTNRELFGVGQPAFEWTVRYRGLYENCYGMNKRREDDFSFDTDLTLKQLKAFLIASPTSRKHHESFKNGLSPLDIMGKKLKEHAGLPFVRDEDLHLRLTMSMFFIFLSN